MAEKCRSLNFFLLVCALLGGLLFYGCGGGTGSDPIPVRILQITGNVNSSVPLANMLASQESSSEPLRASFTTSNIEVYLESNRAQFSTRTDASGNFVLSGIPAGTHRVIAVFTAGDGKVYKVRSTEITVTEREKTTQAPEMRLQQATAYVSGKIVDSAGNPQPNAPLTIWGETFYTDNNGIFMTPPMPKSSTPHAIVVNIPGFQATTINIEFSDNTPFIEQTVVGPTSTNRPPVSSLKASRYSLSTNGQLSLAATASDPDSDTLSYMWSSTAGTFSSSADDLQRVWTAPTESTVATITFSATDPGGLKSASSVMITVGAGQVAQNNPPTVSGITSDATVFLGNTEYQLTVNATDTDKDVLYYTWTASQGSIIAPNTQKTVMWKTPVVTSTTNVQVSVKVDDKKGGVVYETRLFQVTNDPNLPPNQAPVVNITSPVEAMVYLPGVINYTGSANDPESGPVASTNLIWLESKDGGTPVQVAQGTSAARSLIAPGSYHITLTARDEFGSIGSQTVQFRINSTPTVAITSPSGTISAGIGTNVSFSATGNDVEDGNLTGTSIVWNFPAPIGMLTGNSQTINNLPMGMNTIKVNSLDSKGVYSATATVQVNIVNGGPVMSITSPYNNSFVMQNQQYTVSGGGIDYLGSAINPSSMKWELRRTGVATITLGTGVDTFTATGLGDLGEYRLTLTGSDTTNVSSSTSILFTVNATPTVTITSPASGTRFDIGESIEFRADVDDDPDGLMIKWYRDNITVPLNGADGTAAVKGVNTFSTASLPFGNRVIRCEVIDKFGIASSSIINVLVNTLPVATITFSTAQYATAPAEVPVFLSNNPEMTISLTANTLALDTDLVSEANESDILWFTPQSAIPFATGKNITQNFPLGLATVTVRVYDSLRNTFEDLASSTTHFNFYVWQGRSLTGAVGSKFIHGTPTKLYITSSDVKVREYDFIEGLSPVASLSTTYDMVATHSFNAAAAGVLYDGGKLAALGQLATPSSNIYNFANASEPPLLILRNTSGGLITNAISWAAHASDKTYGYFTTSANELFTFNPFTSTSPGTNAENRITTIEGQSFSDLKHVRFVYNSPTYGGMVFVADSGRNRVIRFLDASCSNPRTFPASSPVDIAFTESHVMTLSKADNEITVHEITSSENRVLMKIPLSPAITTPESIYCSGKDLFIVDGTNLFILRSGLEDWLK